MPSSLATQLSQGVSLNSAFLVDRARRNPPQSYLFTPREAERHDLESIHALAWNAFVQLRQWNPAIQSFESSLFSDAAKGLDRTLLPANEVKELDIKISAYALLDSPWAHAELRESRVNEFNVEDILSLFLPYHDSPHFAKMLTILHLKPDAPWNFLNAYKLATQSVPRVALVTEMLNNVPVARFVASALPTAVKEKTVHRTLVAFHTAALLEYISRIKTLSDDLLAFLLPAMLEPLQDSAAQADAITKDIVLSSYVLLSALSHHCVLQGPAIKVILSVMASCSSKVAPQQFVNAALSVLGPQDQLDAFPDPFIEAILVLPDTDVILHTTLWSGFEKLIVPMIVPLVEQHPEIIEDVSRLIIEETRKNKMQSNDWFYHCLWYEISAIRRYTSLIRSQKPSQQRDPPEVDVVVASMDVNGEIRAAAVLSMLRTLREPARLDSENLGSLRSAFLSRVHDSSIAVLEALYSEPSVLAPILVSDPSAFIKAVSEAVIGTAAQTSRAVLRMHLSFIALHLLPAVSQDVVEDAFMQLIFPYLLFSKPKFRTAQAVWEIVQAAQKNAPDAGLGRCESIVGCTEILKEEERQYQEMVRPRKDGSVPSAFEDTGVMRRVNLAIASRMAETILMSNDHAKRFESLLLKLSDPDPHARNLAYLITRALLGMFSGENQVDAAQRVFHTMAIITLEGMNGFVKGAETLHELLNDTNLSTNVVLKPQSRNTLHSLQTSLLCMIPIVPRPSDDTLSFTDAVQSGTETTRNARFVTLLRSMYKLANSSSSLSVIPASLLRSQFIHLADDALAFLVGIWLSEEDAHLRRTALCHAFAFIAAHEATEHVMDFQTVLPALLVALGDPDRAVRYQAAECVQLLVRLSTAKQASGVYAFDTIYQKSTSQLKYLSWDDYQKYTETLATFREHCVHDPTYVRVVHQQYLVRHPSDKKKDIAHKRRIAEYLLSHVTSCGLPTVKLFLITLLEQVSDCAKAEALSPTIQALTDKEQAPVWEKLFGPQFEEFVTIIVSALDASVAGLLNESSDTLWPIFLGAIKFYFEPGSLPLPREALSTNLQNDLFSRLSLDRQKELCKSIITIGAGSSDAKKYCISLLAKLLRGAPLIIQLVADLRPEPSDTSTRATKRVKVAEADTKITESLGSLAFLAEVLSGISLPGDRDLISCLLEVLSSVSREEAEPTGDVAYVQQLLMSSIQNSSTAAQTAGETYFTGIRVDILVDIIRASENPQTFHQALLLIASLARVVPKSVLHNIMPIFTFMGSDVFHRDDNHSFRVVQKTIDSIIPLMVSSLKEKYASREGLLIASKDFLRVFTDATNHIPRHRRTQFFIHLVDVLGPEEFLSIVCMLIISKADKRLVRLQGRDSRAALALPLSLLQHYSSNVQLSVLIEILNEVQPFGESSLSSFDGDIGSLDKLVSALLEISSLQNVPGAAGEHKDITDVAQVARVALTECIRSIHATRFVVSVANILREGRPDERLSRGVLAETLGVFVDKLPSVSTPVRKEASPTIVIVITEIKRFLALEDESVVDAALRALKVIGSSVVHGEENHLVECLPLVLAASRSEPLTATAVAALPPLCTCLGPRIIPFFRDIIQLGVSVLRDALPLKQGESPGVVRDALDILRSVFSSIPTFWGTSELATVFRLYFDALALGSIGEIGPFVRRVSSKAPTAVLLSTYFETWTSISGANAEEHLSGYFELFKRTLRAAPRPPVLEHIRPTFKVFLEGLDLRNKRRDLDVLNVESAVITAFVELVTKLNDTAFRPLFRKLFDWAFTGSEASPERKVAFCNTYVRLLDHFKSLMTPYLSFLLSPFIESLRISDDSEENAFGLTQLCIIRTLTKSMNVDEGTFWRDDRLQQVMPVLIALISHVGGEKDALLTINDGGANDNGIITSKESLLQSLVALCEAVTDDDTLLKRLNLNVLMHTRADEARVRIFALECARALWSAHGSKLIGFVSETATFIVECGEDEHDDVVSAARAFKTVVEGMTGEKIE
ncbi:armadillo-type protein [Multifurca ochricompacta]|uniref:U3 small nucleolar RNA-associated protein 10 n=1 Tax=Multifurca ochricompacta TaxID=376703 RepID=A0AAD4M009_9AGAM|nr:armadillo-type protein [Multifurca ochricompacta]